MQTVLNRSKSWTSTLASSKVINSLFSLLLFFSWVCNQPIVHQDYLDDFPSKSQFVVAGEKSKEENKNHDAEQKPG